MSAALAFSSSLGMARMAAGPSSCIISAWSRVASLKACSDSLASVSARILRIMAKLRSSTPPSAPLTYSSMRRPASRSPPWSICARSSAARAAMKSRCSGETPGCLRGGPSLAPRPAQSCTSGEP
ncbi:Uncharacterised protein [Bordetella pertussis]|nr:Uncharacterised protein [Bordetella pertussis]CFM31596.1 Uncharacterised protein [Bordetella pertussis]CFM44829.1 Uncharacterised protein [Bordetella pertussis]CFM59688.1 Uncharacterised protein [Bordetella pertussis]CFM99365.1 Uncharacterised protein [Bordetella pertussis]